MSWTPVTPRAGGLVHMTSATDVHATACGRVCAGWRVALEQVDCQKCIGAAKPAGKRKKAAW